MSGPVPDGRPLSEKEAQDRHGRIVHGRKWPIVRWARRNPHSCFRQFVWDAADWIEWRFRILPRLRKMNRRV